MCSDKIDGPHARILYALCFLSADEDTPTVGAQQRTAGSHRFAGVTAARPGEDQDRVATSFAPAGKYRAV